MDITRLSTPATRTEWRKWLKKKLQTERKSGWCITRNPAERPRSNITRPWRKLCASAGLTARSEIAKAINAHPSTNHYAASQIADLAHRRSKFHAGCLYTLGDFSDRAVNPAEAQRLPPRPRYIRLRGFPLGFLVIHQPDFLLGFVILFQPLSPFSTRGA